MTPALTIFCLQIKQHFQISVLWSKVWHGTFHLESTTISFMHWECCCLADYSFCIPNQPKWSEQWVNIHWKHTHIKVFTVPPFTLCLWTENKKMDKDVSYLWRSSATSFIHIIFEIFCRSPGPDQFGLFRESLTDRTGNPVTLGMLMDVALLLRRDICL